MFRSRPSVRPLSISIMGMLVWLSWAQQGWATEHLLTDRHAAEPIEDATDRTESKPRLVVLTDMTSISPGVREPDDSQSMIRLMLYANAFDIEGLIASSGLQHGHVVRAEIIHKIVDAYGAVQPNLLLHDRDYPSADRLRSVIKSGQPRADEDIPPYESIGEGKDTEGSEWIIRTIDKPDDRPVWIAIWGGPADLGQALWKVRKLRSPQDSKAFVDKIRVMASGEQDSTAAWIKSSFPDLFYATRTQGGRGMYRGGDTSLAGSEWIAENIRGHGALGDIYPDYKGGDTYSYKIGKVNGIKGGDSSTYMGLISNGLNLRDALTWTNWGGRLEADPKQPNRYYDAIDRVGEYATDMAPYWAAVYRWRPDFQAHYAARFDWSVKPYDEANHAPEREPGPKLLLQDVSAGDRITLDSGEWHDPDGNNLSYHWRILTEESTTSKEMILRRQHSDSAQFEAPNVAVPTTAHVLLTVTDDGDPPLSSYQRVNVTIHPR